MQRVLQSHATVTCHRHYVKPCVLQVSVDQRDLSALITGGGVAAGGGAADGGAAGGGAEVQTPSTSDSSRLLLPPSLLPQSPTTTPSPDSGAASAVLSQLLAVPRKSSFSMKPPTDAPVRVVRALPLCTLSSCLLDP